MNHTLENNKLLIIIETFGGNIKQILDKSTNINHYWSYDANIWPRRTSICFPVCGYVEKNTYILNKKPYEMPFHGFIREMEFQLIKSTPTQLNLLVTSTPQTLKQYPYKFKFELQYVLQDNELQITYIITNENNQPMLYQCGSHYTYNIPLTQGMAYNDYILKAGNVELNLGTNPFKNGAIINLVKDLNTDTITLLNTKSNRSTSVYFKGFKNCVLWAPPGQPGFVCIEPWDGCGDTKDQENLNFESKKDIMTLAPNISTTYLQVIKIN